MEVSCSLPLGDVAAGISSPPPGEVPTLATP